MCRFAAYLGHPILLSELVTEPVHSLIHQSYHSNERCEPLNGDGFGVAWYAPDVSPRPALYKEVMPAWSNQNLRELARVTRSGCVLTHVRAATLGSPVNRDNCHPFTRENLSFMHNGDVAGFPLYRRRMAGLLTDTAFACLAGSTDSEHAFSLLWDYHRELNGLTPLARLESAVVETIRTLERLRHEAGVEKPSMLNFAVSDGEHLVASRFSSNAGEEAASLYWTTGARLYCEDGQFHMDRDLERLGVLLIASEGLSPAFSWTRVPANHMILGCLQGQLLVKPLVGEGLPDLKTALKTTRIEVSHADRVGLS